MSINYTSQGYTGDYNYTWVSDNTTTANPYTIYNPYTLYTNPYITTTTATPYITTTPSTTYIEWQSIPSDLQCEKNEKTKRAEKVDEANVLRQKIQDARDRVNNAILELEV